MKRLVFKNVRFVKSEVKPSHYPIFRHSSGLEYPEIAFAGRSNVGKSSLINNLFQNKTLAKTSATPGKTQLLNFYTVDDSWAFVDLPGYGYAEVPMAVRSKWGGMVQTYLQKRPSLKLILFLFDIRRLPNDEDRMFMEWISQNQKGMILVLTKVDKVKPQECKQNTQKILESFGAEQVHYVHYSTTKNIGRQQLMTLLQDALSSEI